MSRVDYEPIGVRTARNAAAVNAIYTEFESAAPLGPVNFREEGIDARPFVAFPQAEVVERIEATTRTPLGAAGWTTLVMGATTFQSGAVNLQANDTLRLRATVTTEATGIANPGLTVGDTLQIRLRWNDGTTTYVLTYSVRPKRIGAVDASHFRLSTVGRIVGPVNVAWADLQWTLSGGTWAPANVLFELTRFRRIP